MSYGSKKIANKKMAKKKVKRKSRQKENVILFLCTNKKPSIARGFFYYVNLLGGCHKLRYFNSKKVPQICQPQL